MKLLFVLIPTARHFASNLPSLARGKFFLQQGFGRELVGQENYQQLRHKIRTAFKNMSYLRKSIFCTAIDFQDLTVISTFLCYPAFYPVVVIFSHYMIRY